MEEISHRDTETQRKAQKNLCVSVSQWPIWQAARPLPRPVWSRIIREWRSQPGRWLLHSLPVTFLARRASCRQIAGPGTCRASRDQSPADNRPRPGAPRLRPVEAVDRPPRAGASGCARWSTGPFNVNGTNVRRNTGRSAPPPITVGCFSRKAR